MILHTFHFFGPWFFEICIWGGHEKNLWHLHGAHNKFHGRQLFSLHRRHRNLGICGRSHHMERARALFVCLYDYHIDYHLVIPVTIGYGEMRIRKGGGGS